MRAPISGALRAKLDAASPRIEVSPRPEANGHSSQRRTLKASGEYYREVIRTRGGVLAEPLARVR